jgi:pimeloyl-ACP methyl ester carboxylesterase
MSTEQRKIASMSRFDRSDMRTLPTRHGPLAYLQVGSGPPFVLLHGNTMTAISQEKLIRRFADEHTVYGVDLLGHGSSARPDNLFSTAFFQMQGEALADLLNTLFPDQAVPVFGMSAGGVSALNAICEVPERISALILDSVFVYVSEDTVQAHRDSMDELPNSWDIYLRKQHGADWWPTLKVKLVDTIVELEQSGISVAPCLEDIHVPMLVFQGGHDSFTPSVQVRAIEASVPTSQVVYDEDTGHIFSWRDPAGFRELVREFLRDVKS